MPTHLIPCVCPPSPVLTPPPPVCPRPGRRVIDVGPSIRGRVPLDLRVGTLESRAILMCLRVPCSVCRCCLASCLAAAPYLPPPLPLQPCALGCPSSLVLSPGVPPRPSRSCLPPPLCAGTQGLRAESHPRRPCWCKAEPLCEVPLPSPVPANSPVAGRHASAGRRCGTGRDRGMHGGHARAEALPGAGCRDLGAPYRHRLRSFHHHPSSSVGALSGSGWDTWSPFALHVTGALRRDFLPVLRAQPTVTQSLWRSETPATNVACNGATCLHFARSPHPPIFSLLHSAMSAPTKLTPPHDRCPACSHMRTQTAPAA